MPPARSNLESWKRMVLRSMPAPAWLGVDAPAVDVVLSTRARFMRNLRGLKFPITASRLELESIEKDVREAAIRTGIDFEVFRNISNAEREYLVGCRLVSPDFEWAESGRSLLLDRPRALSVMVNEEDHLRLQALTAGWSVDTAEMAARTCLEEMSKELEFAYSPRFGWLSASPFNAGDGRRLSVMLHLIGLAQAKRLPSVLAALTAKGITARGLFGESSRAIGAFVQVSLVNGDRAEFVGAVEYLITAEREARGNLGRGVLQERANQAVEFAISSSTLTLADALRILGWIRWASSAGIEDFPAGARAVDLMLTSLELRGDAQEAKAPQYRAEFLRRALE